MLAKKQAMQPWHYHTEWKRRLVLLKKIDGRWYFMRRLWHRRKAVDLFLFYKHTGIMVPLHWWGAMSTEEWRTWIPRLVRQ